MEMDNTTSEKNESEFANDSNPDELKNIIEAAILVSEEPITAQRILGMFTDATKPELSTVNEILLDLEEEYAHRGFELKRIEKGYRIQTREEYSPWLARLRAGRPPRYSRALLETLAIVAYRQPVTRGEIEEIRGVAVSTDIIRTLVDREWVRQVGVRDVPGKPALFATTSSFLEYFNLQGLSQLPSLQEIRDMDTIAAELNMKLPLDETTGSSEASNTKDNENNEQNPQADLLESAVNSTEEQPAELEENAATENESLAVDEKSSEEDSLNRESNNDDDAADKEASDEDATQPL
jgi:segregation and condensation protein B